MEINSPNTLHFCVKVWFGEGEGKVPIDSEGPGPQADTVKHLKLKKGARTFC